MKTTKTDLLRICKGHYNKDKYDSPYEAIKAYQSKFTGCELEYLAPQHVLGFMFCYEVDTFLTAFDYRFMIKDGILKDYEMSGCCGRPLFEFSIEYLIDKYITQLSLLQVKEGDEWLIDLSDYEQGELVI